MDIVHTSEQPALSTRLAGFLKEHYDLKTSRTAARSGIGWQPEIWNAFAQELDILSAAIPEAEDEEGNERVRAIAEQLGHRLVIEPFIGTAVLGASLLRRAATPVAQAVLDGIGAGTHRVAFASDEPTSYPSGHDITTTAVREGEEWVLNGTKTLVRDAPLASQLIISARTSGGLRDTDGLSLFLLDLDPENPPHGINIHPYLTIDDRRAADIDLIDLRLPDDAMLSECDRAWDFIAPALDEATAAICAEAVGVMNTAVTDTVAYAKQRRQFGQSIGSFQALQHRMVDMHIELEKAAAASSLATLHLGDIPSVRASAVSAAKATINSAAKFIGENAVQLHGGIGMTQELAIGHCFKRLTAIQTEFGTTGHHQMRYASLN